MNVQERLAAMFSRAYPDTAEFFGPFYWSAHVTKLLAADPDLAADIELGMAWREAEKALPEGWWLSQIDAVADSWRAWADHRDYRVMPLSGTGPTPAAALRALTDRLNATEGQTE